MRSGVGESSPEETLPSPDAAPPPTRRPRRREGLSRRARSDPRPRTGRWRSNRAAVDSAPSAAVLVERRRGATRRRSRGGKGHPFDQKGCGRRWSELMKIKRSDGLESRSGGGDIVARHESKRPLRAPRGAPRVAFGRGGAEPGGSQPDRAALGVVQPHGDSDAAMARRARRESRLDLPRSRVLCRGRRGRRRRRLVGSAVAARSGRVVLASATRRGLISRVVVHGHGATGHRGGHRSAMH